MNYDPTQTWREMRDLNRRALAEIASGKAHRAYSALEIAALNAEAERFEGLIDTYNAAKAYEDANLDD